MTGPIRCPYVSPEGYACGGSILWDGEELICLLGGSGHVPAELRGWRPGQMPIPRQMSSDR